MKIVHHDDADGKCAAFWVSKSAFHDDGEAIEFIQMNYNKNFPLEKIIPGEQVYIVDYSIEPDEMRALLAVAGDVVWIDHHITAIEKYKDFEHNVSGIRMDGIAACMLTWVYLNRMTFGGIGEALAFHPNMCNDAPAFVKFIADNDVWKFEHGDTTRYFCTALNSTDMRPDGEIWKVLVGRTGYTWKLVEDGKTMMKFRDGWAAGYMKIGFDTEFEGHLCYACNLGKCNSDYFKSLPKGKYDILMPFVFNGDCWNVSLYSEKVDVSEIAKKYGGGGHKGASGFRCDVLPFKKKVAE